MKKEATNFSLKGIGRESHYYYSLLKQL